MQEDGHTGPREGGQDQGGAPQHPLHTVDFLWSLGRARIKYATHRITVSKTPEITLWVTFAILLFYVFHEEGFRCIWKLKKKQNLECFCGRY